MPSFAEQQSLFRAYDIRGSRQHFTTDFIQALGNAFAHLYNGLLCLSEDSDSKDNLLAQPSISKSIIIVIGYDVRNGSNAIAHKLAHTLAQHGLTVIQLGLVTTPMMVFWAEQYQGHGIIVTASHSAKEILGVKWLVNHQSPSSSEIQSLYQQLYLQKLIMSDRSEHCLKQKSHRQDELSYTTDNFVHSQQADLSTEQIATAYIEAIAEVFQQIYQFNQQHSKETQQPLSKLDFRVVIDCMHGATSAIAQRLFGHFCQDVIMMNDIPDGNFPSGNPDPTEPHRLTQLQQNVLHHQADIGIAFDGDGDRLMIVDTNGKVVSPDHLLYLLAQVAIAERPDTLYNAESIDDTALISSQRSPQVLFDIKCSHHLPKLLSDLDATPVMSRTGSSFMRQQIQRSDYQIVFAGELSGHFIFNDSRFIVYDDAMYAALRLLHWLATDNLVDSKRALTHITESLPAMVSTADHYLPMPTTFGTEYSLVEQLARFCRYLRQILEATAADSDHHLINTDLLLDCHCSVVEPHLTLKQARNLMPVGTTLSCIDGVRLDFPHGFGVLRQSNTSHHLTARFAGDSIDELTDIQTKFAALCSPFDKELAAKIVAIPAE
ncbi:phosphomannomutase [Psychrobacter sp. NG25]|uniref:phosphomannomutase n=1 Tax=Psychrobacter sp. NG25 TaxID=2782005 RepID=UPI001883196C|nr:phosphomannomutase [Psychrobacter sp. NG25]MBF0658189.1 phosphomannomutase [Psychrobacter sp. NG25]